MAAQLLQDDGDGVRPGAPVAHVVVVVQRGSGRIQRLDQTRQWPSSARRCAAGRPGRDCAAAAIGLSASSASASFASSAGRRSNSPAGSDNRQPVGSHRRRRSRGSGASRQRAGHVLVSAFAVSMRDALRRAGGSSSGSAWRPDPVRTGGCSAASTRSNGARRRSRSRAAPSPSGPDRSDTDAEWCGWRTAALRGQRDPAHHLRPGPQGQRLGTVAPRLRQEQRAPGPAERAAVAQVAPRAAHPSRGVGHDRSRRVLVVSARTRSVRCAGSKSSVRSEHSSSRRSAES